MPIKDLAIYNGRSGNPSDINITEHTKNKLKYKMFVDAIHGI